MLISELNNDAPQMGDLIDLEFNDMVIESVIESVSDDSIVVRLDETAIRMLIQEKKNLAEAEYQGRKVQLGKPFLTPDGPKKRSVYVKNPKGNVVKVNFGDPNMRIKKSNPARRKSFRARHNCSTAKDRTSARYWSCRFW
jgi:hypothetical protein